MRTSLTAAALTAALLLPASAQASFVELDDSSPYRFPPRSTVFFDAGDNEVNTLTVTNGPNGALVLNDTGAVIQTEDERCTGDGTNTVTCTPAETTAPILRVALGDGNDTFTNGATIPSEQDVRFEFPGDSPEVGDETFPVVVDAGEGDDTVNGGTSDEVLFGNFGNDRLLGGAGNDLLFDIDTARDAPEDRPDTGGNDIMEGGPGGDGLYSGDGLDTLAGGDGDDFFYGGLARDLIDGGAGNDGVEYALYAFEADGDEVQVKPSDKGVTIVLSDAAATENNGLDGENDRLAGIEDVSGTDGADTLTGSNAGNLLFGRSGNDTITGNGGNDNLDGGGDNDTLNAQDGAVDLADCGGGGATDVANVDNIDQVRNCGSATVNPVVVPPVPPVVIRNPADTTKAKITALKAARKIKAKTFRKKGKYRYSFTPDEAVDLESALESKAGKRSLRSTVGYVTLANASRTLAGGQRATITFTVKKALRKQLKKRKKLRLIIRLTDAGGNITLRRVTIRLT